MLCKAKPYEGEKPYIFFSYCHKNRDVVYPVIERMAKEGFRIWYDNGIHVGDNWLEIIAQHINNASICIAAVTKESVMSHNCRNEVNFAIEYNKKFIPIIFEDFPMSLGVRMQLSSSQYIKKYEQPDEATFFRKLYEAESIENCKGEEPLLVESSEEEKEKFRKLEQERIEKERALQSQKFEKALQALKEKFSIEEYQQKTKPTTEDLIIEEVVADDLIKEGPVMEELEIEDDDEYEKTEVEERTIRIKKHNIAQQKEINRKGIFVRFSEKEIYILTDAVTKIGRSNTKSNIVINKKTISSAHAAILYNSNGFYLRDEDSANGTMLDMNVLKGLQPVQLGKSAIISLADECCAFASDELAEWIIKQKKCAVLECDEMEEIKLLTLDTLKLGRANVWSRGTFSDMRASRNHGSICLVDDTYILEVPKKEATNGTFLNGQRLEPGVKIKLKDGDEIRIGYVYHIKFRWLDLNLGGMKK